MADNDDLVVSTGLAGVSFGALKGPGDGAIDCDYLVIGAGIAGLSIACGLASRGASVLVVDQYPEIPYGSTGRSAALYSTSYFDSTSFAALTVASRDHFLNPPCGFTDVPLARRTGAIHVAGFAEQKALHGFWEEVMKSPAAKQVVRLTNTRQILELVPVLRPENAIDAVYEPEAMNLDVDALWSGYRRCFNRNGGRILTDWEIASAVMRGGIWIVKTRRNEVIRCRAIVNASGAWADKVNRACRAMEIGLQCYRRTALISAPEPDQIDRGTLRNLPFVFAASGDLYFRNEGDNLLLSPANETDTVPRDEQPEIQEVAETIDRFHAFTTIKLKPRPIKTWAGIRSFTADRRPVIGFDPVRPGFFHATALGGFGIESSPAMSRLAVALICGEDMPLDIMEAGLVLRDVLPSFERGMKLANEAA